MSKFKIGLLPKVVIAIILGIVSSGFLPISIAKIFFTFNSIFSNFLSFIIPLIIVGLVAPGIADIGKGAGKLLMITVGIAYFSTILSGLFSYFTSGEFVPRILSGDFTVLSKNLDSVISVKEYFSIDMPPIFGVTTSLVLSFVLGLGAASISGNVLKNGLSEFRDIVNVVITKVIIPLLPLLIFGIFLKIGIEGQAAIVIGTFFKIIILIFVMHIVLLLSQYLIAGFIAKKNPFKSLITMLPAYMTALGTQSSAATIPVTLAQAKKNGINEDIADFVIPLCATIHLAGSMLKIVATAFTVMYMMNMDVTFNHFIGFILALGITMVAAPGVPGGAIMAAIGVLQSMLGFDQQQIGLMIALYIAMDSFGTAANVTGDGAIAIIVNKIYKNKLST